MAFFRYRKGKIPGPGAENYGFERTFCDPLYSIIGAGVVYGEPIAALPVGMMVYHPLPLTTTAGLGGVIFDTMYTYPLLPSTKGV